MGWLAKIAVVFAVAGFVLFDAISVASTTANVADQGSTAAMDASAAWDETHDIQAAFNAAVTSATEQDPGNTVSAKGFAVDPAGVQDPQEPRVGEHGGPTGGPQHPLCLLGLLLGRRQEAHPDRPVEQLVLGSPVRRAVRRPEVFLEPVSVDEPGTRLDGIRRHGTPDRAAAAVLACVGRHDPIVSPPTRSSGCQSCPGASVSC